MRCRLIQIALAVLLVPACHDRQPSTSPLTVHVAVAAVAYECAGQAQIPTTECEALVSLYNATNGPAWRNATGWLQNTTPCTWFGVRCGSGSVEALNLGSNLLSGSVPPDLQSLRNLRELEMGANQLTGAIPPQLGALTRLWRLSFQQNQLTGPIPPELGNLVELLVLALDFNRLTGPIPPQLGNLRNLGYLGVGDNALTGSIPPELGNLSNLATLEIFLTQVTGPIPPELGNLSQLNFLFLFGNQLTGSIPSALGNLSNLRALSLGRNQLTGGIPVELGNLSQLFLFDVGSNQLTGLIPIQLANLSALQRLDLSANQLGGQVPLAVAARGASIPQDACFFTPGNPALFMPGVAEYRALDVDGDGRICGLAFTIDAAGVAAEIESAVRDLQSTELVNRGQANALTRKIDQALSLFQSGSYADAIAVLNGFIQQVTDLTNIDHVLTPTQAEPLLVQARLLIQLIEAAAEE